MIGVLRLSRDRHLDPEDYDPDPEPPRLVCATCGDDLVAEPRGMASWAVAPCATCLDAARSLDGAANAASIEGAHP